MVPVHRKHREKVTKSWQQHELYNLLLPTNWTKTEARAVPSNDSNPKGRWWDSIKEQWRNALLKNYRHMILDPRILWLFTVKRFYREVKTILTWKYLVTNPSYKISSQTSFSAQHRHLLSPSKGFTSSYFFFLLKGWWGREGKRSPSLPQSTAPLHTHTDPEKNISKTNGWDYYNIPVSVCVCFSEFSKNFFKL